MFRRPEISSMLSRSTQGILEWEFSVFARVFHRQAPTFFCVMNQLKVIIGTFKVREERKQGARGHAGGDLVHLIRDIENVDILFSLVGVTLLRMSSCFLQRPMLLSTYPGDRDLQTATKFALGREELAG